MKLLLDANLSWRLINKLHELSSEIRHVEQIDITQPAKDMEIWQYAKSHDQIIITNDEDFLSILTVKGFPPKIVLLRTGNQSNQYLAKILIKHLPEIKQLEQSPEMGILEIY